MNLKKLKLGQTFITTAKKKKSKNGKLAEKLFKEITDENPSALIKLLSQANSLEEDISGNYENLDEANEDENEEEAQQIEEYLDWANKKLKPIRDKIASYLKKDYKVKKGQKDLLALADEVVWHYGEQA